MEPSGMDHALFFPSQNCIIPIDLGHVSLSVIHFLAPCVHFSFLACNCIFPQKTLSFKSSLANTPVFPLTSVCTFYTHTI